MTNDLYSRKTIEYIKSNISDDNLKEALLCYYKNNFCLKVFSNNSEKAKYKTALTNILKILPCSSEKVTWKSYCDEMRSITLAENIRRKEIPRTLLSEIYNYIIEYLKDLDLDNIKELYNRKEYLIFIERTMAGEQLSEYERDNIATNFQINTNIDDVAIFSYDGRGKEVSVNKTIINLNTSNSVLKQLLCGFLLSLNDNKRIAYMNYRFFVYYFEASLCMDIEKIEDFNFHTFRKQYRFYKKLSVLKTINDKKSLDRLLVAYYAYLMDELVRMGSSHNIFNGTAITKEFLTSVKFRYGYENGYVYVLKNGLTNMPVNDRWAIVNHDSKAHNRSTDLVYFDFKTIRSNEYRQDYKDYIWNDTQANVKSHSTRFANTVEFLNMKDEYNKSKDKAINLEAFNPNIFDTYFIYSYKAFILDKYDDQATRRASFKGPRGFIRNFKKFKISPILFSVLNYKEKEYSGGTPINMEDLNRIYQIIKKNKDLSIRHELYYIIFNLAATTKLRLGEILNLNLNFKGYEYEERKVTEIRYYSKESNGEIIKTEIANEKIKLLEKAIELTQDVRTKAGSNKNYIFITEDIGYKNRICKLTTQFYNYFHEIVFNLEGVLAAQYTAYNLRHTFIDTVYNEGIKDNLHPLVLSTITGNSYAIAIRNYRQKTQIQEYAEMFAGVTISDVSVDGHIINNTEVDDLPPVEKNLGACNSVECVDSSERYKCLICTNFVTATSRIIAFERNIEALKNKKKSAKTEVEKKYYDMELKLNATYYSRLIELKQKESKG